jgi:hypothetical protein
MSPAFPRARRRPLAGVLAAPALLAGCYSQPAPAIRVVDAHVVEATSDGVVVLFTIEGENRGTDSLPLRAVNYNVSIGGRPVFEGVRSAGRTLPRGGSQSITLPAAAPVGAFPAGPPRAGAPFEITGTIEYETPGVLSDILFDAGVLRPTVAFSGVGALSEDRPREAALARPRARPADAP